MLEVTMSLITFITGDDSSELQSRCYDAVKTKNKNIVQKLTWTIEEFFY